MKLRNKKTGEIIDDGYVRETHDFQFDGQKHVLAVFKGNGHSVPERVSGAYTSLAELNEEWEDYEEPKEYWYIDDAGVTQIDQVLSSEINMRKSIGNYFETKEEAERAVKKLKAWKRLKDKGFRFTGWEDLNTLDVEDSLLVNRDIVDGECVVGFRMNDYKDCIADLDLLFGGEE